MVTSMNGLIIPSTIFEQGVDRLKAVLNRAAEYNLRINWEKCQFQKATVNFFLHYRS